MQPGGVRSEENELVKMVQKMLEKERSMRANEEAKEERSERF